MKIDCSTSGSHIAYVLKEEKKEKKLELAKATNYHNHNKIQLKNNPDVIDISSG